MTQIHTENTVAATVIVRQTISLQTTYETQINEFYGDSVSMHEWMATTCNVFSMKFVLFSSLLLYV